MTRNARGAGGLGRAWVVRSSAELWCSSPWFHLWPPPQPSVVPGVGAAGGRTGGVGQVLGWTPQAKARTPRSAGEKAVADHL
ncbi:MAG TPA: hypothetical protein VFF52_02770 [Isosphaeraceae bacterium]|nr:hypothetical protein [Isosphaeraceae bacterium]